MNKQAAIEIVKGYAPHYPTVTTFFVSSDGQVFFEKHTAEGHGRSLKANDVHEVHVSDLLDGMSVEVDPDEDDETDDTSKTGESKAPEAETAPEQTAPNKATTHGKTADEIAPEKPAKKNNAK